MTYIVSTLQQDPENGCVFCRMMEEDDDESNLVVYRGKLAFVVMNLYPYNSGHLLVVPKRHTGDFASLTAEEHHELCELLDTCQKALKLSSKPHGFNIGMNLGQASGAGITDHLHYHVVPRWAGDSNFMSVVGDTKVISEGLTEGWQRLRESFLQLRRESS